MITQETFTIRALDGVTRRYDQSGKRVGLGTFEGEPDITLTYEVPQADHVIRANEQYRQKKP